MTPAAPSSRSSRHIVIVAGEVSGDQHAAALVEELRKIDPRWTFSGLGGPRMRAAGVRVAEDMTRLAVVGFFEVLRHYGRFHRIFHDLLARIRDERPAAVVLVDYPGFNLRLARRLKAEGVPVVYYISPQVWAWKAGRMTAIHADTDLLLVLFRFEEDFYRRHGLKATWTGHPIVDRVKPSMSREAFLRSQGLDPRRLTVGLLPGSRIHEIRRHLPVMRAAAERLHASHPNSQYLLLCAPTFPSELIPREEDLPWRAIWDAIYDGIHACDLCLVASGTATLETALLGTPMVVVYRTSWPTALAARCLIRIRDIGLVNIVAGRRIVPECIQGAASPRRIAAEAERLLEPEERRRVAAALAEVRRLLGPPGGSRRAAEEIARFLEQPKTKETS